MLYQPQYVKFEKEFNTAMKEINSEELNELITVIHEDGSSFIFRNAKFWKSHKSEFWGWIGIVTEHCGDHIFSTDDLLTFNVAFSPLHKKS